MVDGLDIADQPFYVYFEYKKSIDTEYNSTELKTYTKVGSYFELIKGLEDNTSYDIVAVINDGTTTARGVVVTCQTLTNLSNRTAVNYDTLITKTVATLQTELSAGRISTALYGNYLISSIQNTMQLGYTMAVKEGTIDESEILLQKQIESAQADIDLKKTQEEQLILSVDYNNQIHSLASLGDMIGQGMIGQVLVETPIFQKFFDMIAALDGGTKVSVGNTPATKL
jgi:hypothetical protein